MRQQLHGVTKPSPFAFVDGALDRADHLRDDPDTLSTLWPQARVVLLEDDGRALADGDDALLAPDGATLGGGPGTAIFLGMREGQAWFAQSAKTVAFDAPARIDLRSAATQWPTFDSTVFAQARAMLHWHARHKFCGVCGGDIGFVRAGWLGQCARCGSEHYPRTDQAIIAAVSDGDRLLLGRQRNWPARRWSVIAGFVEPGESLEQTVAREVLEETGVRVRSCRYVASQPWPFPGSLMLGFLAEAGPDVPVVGDELDDARWFDADTIRAGLARDWAVGPEEEDSGIALSAPISIARWLIQSWLASVTR
ncbi:MAG: NAD(+) diphosphatase [Lysobacter sp.]|nr:NAD(+) diphosphatase [Lysobacter sp.]